MNSDTEIINRLIKQDETAFREFVEKHQQLVINTCNGFVHNSDDANDIAQEVFIEIFKSLNSFRKESKLSTWLYRIAVNKSLNFIRKNKKHSILRSIDSYFNTNDGDEKKMEIPDNNLQYNETGLENQERSVILHKAIDSLPKNQKIAFTLNKYDDVHYNEIAEIMDLSLSAVESLIHRAKLGLQKKLLSY
ncbi:MAG: RNA polymerase sigma factor, partial [Bacteroidales bacterium]|nr:RNA polymerase sigma factor [Bacteroidales bacterium]